MTPGKLFNYVLLFFLALLVLHSGADSSLDTTGFEVLDTGDVYFARYDYIIPDNSGDCSENSQTDAFPTDCITGLNGQGSFTLLCTKADGALEATATAYTYDISTDCKGTPTSVGLQQGDGTPGICGGCLTVSCPSNPAQPPTPDPTPQETTTPSPTPSSTPTQTPAPTPSPTPKPVSTPKPPAPPNYCTGTYCATLHRLNCLPLLPTACGNCMGLYTGAAGPSNVPCVQMAQGARPTGAASSAQLKVNGVCSATLVTNFRTALGTALRFTQADRFLKAVCSASGVAGISNIDFTLLPTVDPVQASALALMNIIRTQLGNGALYKTVTMINKASTADLFGQSIKSVAGYTFCFTKWVAPGTCTTTSALASTITVAASPVTPIFFGNAITTLTATIKGPAFGTLKPTGVVYFWNSGKLLGTANIATGTNVATFKKLLTGGSYSITAGYYGDVKVKAVSKFVPLAYRVNRSRPKITLTADPSDVQKGQAVTFTASLSVIANTIPTGTLIFYNLNTITLTKVTYVHPKTTFTTSALPLGANRIKILYSGDDNYVKFQNSSNVPVAVCSQQKPKTPCPNGQHRICCTTTPKNWACKPSTQKVC